MEVMDMAPRKDYQFKFPFEPPLEDLRKTVVTSNGTVCYIYDTFVEKDPEEIRKIEQRVADIVIRHEQKVWLREHGEEAGSCRES
jgi:outer membrane lipoprotein-sorting protein